MYPRITYILWLLVALAGAGCGGSGNSETEASAEAEPSLAPGAGDRYTESIAASGLDTAVGYGRGAAFADIDGDGFDDLFAADTDARHRPNDFGVSQMFLNNRDGSFRLADVGIDDADLHGAWVGSFADYDNDGDPDLLLGAGGYTLRSTLSLYENRMDQSGRFVNVSAAAGLAGISRVADSFWWGAAWADFDNDGWLDLVLTRREDSALLLRSNGDKTFTQLTSSPDMRDVKNPVWFDFDEDGDQDLYLAGMVKHIFFENRINSNEGFVDITASIPFPGDAELAIGPPLPSFLPHPNVFAATTADFDQDGHEDLYLGRWDRQDHILFGHGDGSFTAIGAATGIDALTDYDKQAGLPYENTMGLGVGDLFDDGYPDILIGTGDPATSGADLVFCNTGNRRFERCTDRFIDADDRHLLTRAHGVSFADADRDGFVEVFWNLGGHPSNDIATPGVDTRERNKFYRRSTDRTPSPAWLRLRGSASNRDAIGSRLEVVYENGDRRYYFLHSTSGFQSQNSNEFLIPMFGEASALLNVTWPNGQSSQHSLTENGSHLIVQP